MVTTHKFKIALLGDHPDFTEWKQQVISHLQLLQNQYTDPTVGFHFYETLNPAILPFIPISSFGAQVVDLILSREQLLAALADITVLVDNGLQNETIKKHSDRIERNTKTLIIWSPDEKSITNKPIEPDEIGIRPGVIYLISSIKLLAACLYFLCVDAQASFLTTPQDTTE